MHCTLKLLIFYFFFGSVLSDAEDSCDGNASCVPVTSCGVAVRAIKENGFHDFKRCGFEDKTEIVCCPDTENKFGTEKPKVSPRPASKFKRIADQECDRIVETTTPPLNVHILGGEEAAVGEFPHMVAIGFNRGEGWEFNCGGSLLSTTYIVTAAHCIENLDKIDPEMVRVGVAVIGERKWNDETDYRIAEIKTHPEYTPREKYHDLALIRLQKPVDISNNVNPVCLYTGSEDPDIALTITGWGVTNTKLYNSKSNILLKANVTLYNRTECAQSYTLNKKLPRGVIAQQLCAGDREGIRDTCQGDSGGPLQAFTAKDGQYRLIGITSFGRACGVYPGIYTRISEYLDWIESVVWPSK